MFFTGQMRAGTTPSTTTQHEQLNTWERERKRKKLSIELFAFERIESRPSSRVANEGACRNPSRPAGPNVRNCNHDVLGEPSGAGAIAQYRAYIPAQKIGKRAEISKETLFCVSSLHAPDCRRHTSLNRADYHGRKPSDASYQNSSSSHNVHALARSISAHDKHSPLAAPLAAPLGRRRLTHVCCKAVKRYTETIDTLYATLRSSSGPWWYTLRLSCY